MEYSAHTLTECASHVARSSHHEHLHRSDRTTRQSPITYASCPARPSRPRLCTVAHAATAPGFGFVYTPRERSGLFRAAAGRVTPDSRSQRPCCHAATNARRQVLKKAYGRPLPGASGRDNRVVSPAGSGRDRFHGGLGARAYRLIDRSKPRRMILAWLAGLGLVVVSGWLPLAVGLVVILGACVLMGAVLGAYGGEPSGLRDHRQQSADRFLVTEPGWPPERLRPAAGPTPIWLPLRPTIVSKQKF